ncbi:MAG: hypothetical protein KJO69_02540 [Gammaproteobacteria bacterium]|nr:hypothetical protein [Gammaproteobacteria bacterium]NNJ71589.1 hypothetical protein [Enterobacterales bacterium]
MKNILRLTLTLFLLMYAASTLALSPEAEEGKALFAACNVCHDQTLDPPQGPPMWSVQRIYKREFADDKTLIKNMVAFVKSPSKETAIHQQAVKHLGLMPAMPLPDDMLTKIATYILEAKFPPPCEHWKNAAKRAGAMGDSKHAQKDHHMFERFCSKQ